MTNRLYCLALFACSLLVSHSVQAQEWTRFHGPNGQGVATTKSFPAQWSEDNVVFKRNFRELVTRRQSYGEKRYFCSVRIRKMLNGMFSA